MKHSYIIGMAMMLLTTSESVKAQDVALKTNLLGWATTSLNAGIEIGTAEKQTAQVFATLNPWTFSGSKRVRIWNVEPEYRWWTCHVSEVASLVCMPWLANTTLKMLTCHLALWQRPNVDATMKDGTSEPALLTDTNGCFRNIGILRLQSV